jgi:hypothetical protein
MMDHGHGAPGAGPKAHAEELGHGHMEGQAQGQGHMEEQGQAHGHDEGTKAHND